MLFSNVIHDHIQQLMQAQNLSISELSRRANLTQSTVNSAINTRNTNPRIDTLHKLIKALNITIEEFFSAKIFKELD